MNSVRYAALWPQRRPWLAHGQPKTHQPKVIMRVDKEILRETMLGLEASQLQASQANYEQFLDPARLDGGEIHDAQDVSQAIQAGDYAQAFDAPIHAHEHTIELLKEIDFGEALEVRPGAVVKWGGQNFVVSALTSEFECQGETFMGISPSAPIAQAMASKSAGDTFEINGMTHSIEDVY